MNKAYAVLIAVLLTLPIASASHGSYQSYESYGDYDYSYNKDFEYVKYHETEDAYRNHDYNSCGNYDYGYYGSYGSNCRNNNDQYSYHRSRDFEFGRYHEDVQIHGDHYDTSYNSYQYPSNSYNDYYPSYDYYPTYSYDTDYEGGGYSMGAGIYGYLPYNY